MNKKEKEKKLSLRLNRYSLNLNLLSPNLNKLRITKYSNNKQGSKHIS